MMRRLTAAFFMRSKRLAFFAGRLVNQKHRNAKTCCFFDTPQQAIAAGFRPCKRCRSDLAAFHPDRVLALQAKELLDSHWANPQQLTAALEQLGVSRHRLNQVLQAEYGLAPVQYVAALRLKEAKHRLQATNDSITAVAEAVGFEQTASFCRFFKAQTGQTPGSYRKEQKA